MAGNVDHDALTMRLMEFVPNATPEQATQYLSANNWDLDAAAASIMADMEEADDDAAQVPTAGASASSSAAPAAPAGYSGPRTLDGRPAPQVAYGSNSSSSRKKTAPKKKGVATLSSLGAGADDDDDDSEDEDDDDPRRPRDLFAGGEKSGLAVQDPNRRGGPDPRSIAQDLVNQAKSNQQQRPEASSPAGPSAPSSAFRGPAQTLGGEGVESQAIPAHGPRGGQAQPSGPVQERTLHLWRDGFSIDDGALRRYDDPANADDLRMIQNGRAPVHLMNVRYDEPLDVKLQQHDEDFHQLPKIYRPFSGEGRRLGSPVPGDGGASIDSTVSAQPTTAAPAASASSAAAPASTASTSEVDSSQPVVMIRIQMLDGTRLPARFNTTHTIGDVYDFISRSSPSLPSGWVLSTTFPNKDHTDKSLVLGDLAEFKKGGTAVVKRCT